MKDTGLHKNKIPLGGRLSESVKGKRDEHPNSKDSFAKLPYEVRHSIFKHKDKLARKDNSKLKALNKMKSK